jgi:putative tricarboxylic transport membrane protein
MQRISVRSALVAGLLALTAMPASADDWKPERTISFYVGSTAGGANDRQARLLQEGLAECCLDGVTVNVINKPGAEQNLAVEEIRKHPKDPYQLALVSSTWIGGQMTRGDGDILQGLDPLVLMWSNYQVLAVNADSDIKDAADMKARLAKDPSSVSFAVAPGGGSPGNLALIRIGKLAGAKPAQMRIVAFDGAKEAVAQAAGGHIDVVIASIGTAMPLVNAGNLRLIGVGAPERVDGLADVPTLREQGLDVVASYSFMVIGPTGLTDAQKAYWTSALKKAAQQKVVMEGVQRDSLSGTPTSEGVADWIHATVDEMREGLTDLGLINKQG